MRSDPDELASNLSAREHAALQLRLPESGTPWLDEMIAKARRLDTATAAMPSALMSRFPVSAALEEADNLLREATGPVDLTAHPIGADACATSAAYTANAPAEPPTMEIDGVLYVEAPGRDIDMYACRGCAFNADGPLSHLCNAGSATAKEVFGGTCGTRNVIYIKKEAAHG